MDWKHNVSLFIFSAIYLLLICYCFTKGFSVILLAPIVLAVFLAAIFRFHYLLYAVIILTPFSISLSELGFSNLGLDIAFPTEPILFGLMVMTIWKISYDFSSFKPIVKHPITLLVLLYLFWILITSSTSTMPIVSFKFFLTRMWYVFPLLFMGVLLFRKPNSISYFVLLYTVPLSVVILYTILKHANYFFDKHSAHYMMSPFFNDHTSYGAVIAFFLPFNVAFFLIHKNHFIRVLLICLISILTIGLILSFTRAAWISLLLAVIIVMILKLKINRKLLFFVPLISLFSLLLFSGPILSMLEQNKQDSSDNLIEHVTSISNISTDASNMERINRWKCALNMFYEKPFFGWGPGTYQFQYGSFQLSQDRTIISSNSGDMGNAHSEYLGALSETGLLGFLSFLILCFATVIRAINMYYESNSPTHSTWLLAIITSLISYFIHGVFNNFIDTDKMSVALWCVVAIVISFDLFNNKNNEHDSNFENNFS